MWLHHYQSLLNSIPDSHVHIHKINKYCSNIQFNDNMVLKAKELQEIISNTPVGKASGYDHISNEHFKYANEKLHVTVIQLSVNALFLTWHNGGYYHSSNK